MRLNACAIALVAVIFCISGFARAAEQPSPKLTLISNVDIFDGQTERLHKNMHVLVKDNLIEPLSNEPLAVIQTDNVTIIADGVPEVTKRAREIMRAGASQIKVMAGGGVSSFYDPIDVTQYSLDEMKAIVGVANPTTPM